LAQGENDTARRAFLSIPICTDEIQQTHPPLIREKGVEKKKKKKKS
jgi:hypothetical protein